MATVGTARRSPPRDAAAGTRERLIGAAERLFAARGYRATSVRAITAAADCNLASVTYHFGGKLPLYRETLERRLRLLREQRVRSVRSVPAGTDGPPDPAAVVRAFTMAFLEPHLDERRGHLLMNLFSRELLDPHLRPGTLQREIIDPVEEALVEALRRTGVRLRGRAARRCVESVVAQLAHAVRMRGIAGAASARVRDDFARRGIVDHIVTFSIAGIAACAEAD